MTKYWSQLSQVHLRSAINKIIYQFNVSVTCWLLKTDTQVLMNINTYSLLYLLLFLTLYMSISYMNTYLYPNK